MYSPSNVPARTDRFPFWGSPSLRPTQRRLAGELPIKSLPLLGKPFIEAGLGHRRRRGGRCDRFPFWGSPSLRRHHHPHPLRPTPAIASPSGEALH